MDDLDRFKRVAAGLDEIDAVKVRRVIQALRDNSLDGTRDPERLHVAAVLMWVHDLAELLGYRGLMVTLQVLANLKLGALHSGPKDLEAQINAHQNGFGPEWYEIIEGIRAANRGPGATVRAYELHIHIGGYSPSVAKKKVAELRGITVESVEKAISRKRATTK